MSKTKVHLAAVQRSLIGWPEFDSRTFVYWCGDHVLRISNQWLVYHSQEQLLEKLIRFRRYAKAYQRRSQ